MTLTTTSSISDLQRRALRELNHEHRDRDQQVAFNRTEASLHHARRLYEDNYRRKRKALIDADLDGYQWDLKA
jgi:hypothetical protein